MYALTLKVCVSELYNITVGSEMVGNGGRTYVYMKASDVVSIPRYQMYRPHERYNACCWLQI